MQLSQVTGLDVSQITEILLSDDRVSFATIINTVFLLFFITVTGGAMHYGDKKPIVNYWNDFDPKYALEHNKKTVTTGKQVKVYLQTTYLNINFEEFSLVGYL